MATPLRDTGIDVLGSMPWGSHVSIFHETRRDLLEIIVPFLAAGLEADELCVWLPSDADAEREVRDELRQRVPDFDRRQAAGQVEFVDVKSWYRESGNFRVADVIRKWDELYERFQQSGYVGLRGTGSPKWLEAGERERVMQYERELEDLMRERRSIILCTYSLDNLTAAELLTLAEPHHVIAVRRRGHWTKLETPEHKRAIREIERLNAELEHRVEERTRELRRSEWYLAESQRLTRSGSCGMKVPSREITYWSAEMNRLFGFDEHAHPTFDEMLEHVHPDDRARVRATVDRVERTGDDAEHAFRVVLPDDRLRYVRDVLHAIRDDDGRVTEILGSHLDITEARRANARLARVKRRAREQALEARFAAILEERTRLAREIHDSLLQGVTGIALQLRAMLPHLRAAPPDAIDAVRRITDLAEATARDARQTVWEMRPLAALHADLATALRDILQRVSPPPDVHLSVEGEPRPLPAGLEETVLRVAQESATNAVKHSGTTSINVTLTYTPDGVALSVTDEGHGFDTESAFRTYASRWGLLGMRERAHRIGGSLIVRSRPGAGTTVELHIPLENVRPLDASA